MSSGSSAVFNIVKYDPDKLEQMAKEDVATWFNKDNIAQIEALMNTEPGRHYYYIYNLNFRADAYAARQNPSHVSLPWADMEKYRYEPGGIEEKIICQEIKYAYDYCRYVIRDAFTVAEPLFAKSNIYSLKYALFLERPFPAGENTISQSIMQSLEYARTILKGRFHQGEPIIATNTQASFNYSMMIEARFKAGELAIAKSNSKLKMYEQMLAQKDRDSLDSFLQRRPLLRRYGKIFDRVKALGGEELNNLLEQHL